MTAYIDFAVDLVCHLINCIEHDSSLFCHVYLQGSSLDEDSNALRTRLELASTGLKVLCSNQLNYRNIELCIETPGKPGGFVFYCLN